MKPTMTSKKNSKLSTFLTTPPNVMQSRRGIPDSAIHDTVMQIFETQRLGQGSVEPARTGIAVEESR